MTGVIFAVIAAAWLMYLVPYFLRSREDLATDEPVEVPFTPSVTIVRSGTSLADADPGTASVSTPLTRRAQLRELRALDRQAAQRRRRVLIFLLVVEVLVSVLAVFGVGAWWGAIIPAVLIVGFLILARFSSRSMRSALAREAESIRECPDEETVALSLSEADVAPHQHSVELSVPTQTSASLLEPIPITRPTYVSKPLAPRTVRTIDLSAPVQSPRRVPVTADPLVEVAEEEETGSQEDVG